LQEGEAIWQIATPDFSIQKMLAENLKISPVTAQLLINRGIKDLAEAKDFLDPPDLSTIRGLNLPGLDPAAAELKEALLKGRKILVYGDYDVDGITSTALMVEHLGLLGGRAEYYIPDRLTEGYGLNFEALEAAAAAGIELVITVDCGVTAVAEIARARELGLKVVVTDHHEPGAELPPAEAVVDPKLNGGQPLAGVGVAYCVLQALDRLLGESIDLERGLDLVALGTIADLVPLTGINRTLVKKGLGALNRLKRPGLKALARVSGLEDKEITPGSISFALAPRINAAGRLGDARPAVELFLDSSEQRVWELSRQLNTSNIRRQQIEAEILHDVLGRINSEQGNSGQVVVLAGSDWHPGVVGIVAARVVDRLKKPVILIALEGEEGRGSGRSIPGLNLFEALKAASRHLIRFGGHQMAAGLSIEAGKVQDFSLAMEEWVGNNFSPQRARPRLLIDEEVSPRGWSPQLVREIRQLEPFGIGNPEPLFSYRQARVQARRLVGKGAKHLKLVVEAEGLNYEAIGFQLAALDQVAAAAQALDIVYTPEINNYLGRERFQLVLKDLRAADGGAGLYDSPQPIGPSLPPIDGPEGPIYPLEMAAVLAELAGGDPVVVVFRSSLDLKRHQVILENLLAAWGHLARVIDPARSEDILRQRLADWSRGRADILVCPQTWLEEQPLFGHRGTVNLLAVGNFNPEDKLTITSAFKGLSIGRQVWCEEGPAGAAELVDARGHDPASYLVNALKAGRPQILYTGSSAEVIRWGRIIQDKAPLEQDRVAYYHQRQNWETNLLALEQFRHGLADLLVASAEVRVPEEASVFVNTIPLGREQARALLSGGQVHLVYGDRERQSALRRLNALAPDRRALGMVFLELKNQGGALTVPELVRHLQNQGWRTGGQYAVLAALSILEELKLVQLSPGGSPPEVKLLPPAGKRELDASWRFRERQKNHQEGRQLAQAFSDWPAEKIGTGFSGRQ